MATHPDDHPDTAPSGPSEDVERVSPGEGRPSEGVEDTPGTDGGTGGTGGTNHAQDHDVTS